MGLFIVEAHMSEPLVTYGGGIHLDGPLSYAAYMETPRIQRDQIPPIERDWAEDFDLPLARWTHRCDLPETAHHRLTIDGKLTRTSDGYEGIVWGWSCSAAMPEGKILVSNHSLRKRPAIEELKRYTNQKRYDSGSGPYKAKDLIFPTVQTRILRWYCKGDQEKTRWLLTRHVPAIGKLASHGMGRVSEWQTLDTANDYTLQHADGRPMRRLPAYMFAEWPWMFGSFRAPYHHRSRYGKIIEAEAWNCENQY